MKIAVGQFAPTADTAENLGTMRRLTEQAAAGGAQAVGRGSGRGRCTPSAGHAKALGGTAACAAACRQEPSIATRWAMRESNPQHPG